jgi:hypothetical protein
MEVTSRHIEALVPTGMPGAVMPVVYLNDQGKEEDPILIMKLSKNQ